MSVVVTNANLSISCLNPWKHTFTQRKRRSYLEMTEQIWKDRSLFNSLAEICGWHTFTHQHRSELLPSWQWESGSSPERGQQTAADCRGIYRDWMHKARMCLDSNTVANRICLRTWQGHRVVNEASVEQTKQKKREQKVTFIYLQSFRLLVLCAYSIVVYFLRRDWSFFSLFYRFPFKRGIDKWHLKVCALFRQYSTGVWYPPVLFHTCHNISVGTL